MRYVFGHLWDQNFWKVGIMIRKIIFVVLWASVGLSFLHAQEEQDMQREKGAFVGFGLGSGGGGAMIDVIVPNKMTKGKASQNFIYYDFKAGYRYFLNEWFGLRGYARLKYSNAKNASTFDTPAIPTLVEQDFSVNIIDYDANLDLLFNVYATKDYYVGLLSGVGMGGSNLGYRDRFLGNQNTNTYQTNLKVGASLNAHNHSVELTAEVLLFKPSIVFKPNGASIKMDFKQNYILSMSYIYNFGAK